MEKPFPKVSPWNSMEDKRKALREVKTTKHPLTRTIQHQKFGFSSWFLKSLRYISLRLVSTEVSRTITGVFGPSDNAGTKVSKRTHQQDQTGMIFWLKYQIGTPKTSRPGMFKSGCQSNTANCLSQVSLHTQYLLELQGT